MKWGLLIGNRAKRQLGGLPADGREQINKAFSQMCEDPFEGDVKFLRGLHSLRRRVGDWRILFELSETERIILVTAVKRRGSNTY